MVEVKVIFTFYFQGLIEVFISIDRAAPKWSSFTLGTSIFFELIACVAAFMNEDGLKNLDTIEKARMLMVEDALLAEAVSINKARKVFQKYWDKDQNIEYAFSGKKYNDYILKKRGGKRTRKNSVRFFMDFKGELQVEFFIMSHEIKLRPQNLNPQPVVKWQPKPRSELTRSIRKKLRNQKIAEKRMLKMINNNDDDSDIEEDAESSAEQDVDDENSDDDHNANNANAANPDEQAAVAPAQEEEDRAEWEIQTGFPQDPRKVPKDDEEYTTICI